MAKSKVKTGDEPLSAVPVAELWSASDATLEAKYSRAQLVESLRTWLSHPNCPEFEAMFERAVRWDISADASERVAWANRYVAASRGLPDAVPWWDVTSRQWLLGWARRAPAELAAQRAEFAKPLQKLTDFCLALTLGETMPEDVAAAIAKHFLNSPPTGFGYAGLIDLSHVSAFAEQALGAGPFPILRRERVAELASFASPRLLLGLAVNYCASDFRRVGTDLLTGERAAVTLADVEEWAEKTRSPEGRIVLSLVYARLVGQNSPEVLPEWTQQAFLLDLRSGSLDDVDVTREALLALPSGSARSLLGQALREERATLLIPALADEGLLHEFLSRVEAGDVSRDTAVEALGHCGGEGLAALLSFPGCVKPLSKVTASLATVVAEALGRLLIRSGSNDHRRRAAEVLVPWLGHSSKAVVVAVKRSIEVLGEDAGALLIAALQSGKKQTRLEAERLLERLTQQQQPVAVTPLEAVRDRAQAVGGDEFLRLCQDVYQRSETWATVVRPLVSKQGALCLQWLRPWFEEHVPQGDVRLWCYVVDLLADDTEAVWVAVDTFARMPKLPTSLWARPRRALSRLGEKLAAPSKHVLTYGSTEYAEPLYGLLAAYAGEEAVELLMAALSADSKAIRGHAVDGLSRVATAPIEPVLTLLSSENPGVRISVAELLAVWGRTEARESLRAALRSESRAPVRAYLEEALAATGAAPLWDQAVSEGASAASIEQALDAALQARGQGEAEPRFLLDSPLPELAYKSGNVLDKSAALGFLSLVTELDSTLKGRLVRQVSARLDAATLAAWSRHLYARWNRSKDTKFKWAIYQVWLLADEALVDEVGAGLGQLRANEHVVVACSLRVLQWRASPRALDWLVHWASALHSRGARTLAQTLLGRVAYRSGKSVSALRAAADCWIHQRHYERVLCTKPALERFDTERFVQYLEDCLFSGRTWTWEEWSGLNERFPDLFKRLYWRVELAEQSRSTDGVVSSSDGEAPAFAVALSRRGVFQAGSGERVEGDQVRTIALAHPVLGGVDDWRKVSQWIGDKPADAPLPQLERQVYTYGGDVDLELSRLTTDSERLDRWIKRRGWFHGEALDHGLVYSNTKTLGALGLMFQLNHSGYPIGQHDFAERVQLHSLEVFELDGKVVDFAGLGPQVYSELCYQLSKLVEDER